MAKAKRDMFTAAELKKWMHYDPDTGVFTWLQKASSRAMPGYRVGCINKTYGYRVTKVLGCQCRTARLAWLYMTGGWPEDEIDHENNVRDDDRWVNLRPASRWSQLANIRPRTTHLKGIYQRKSGRWMAQVSRGETRLNLGCYDTQEEAHAAYRAAALKLFGEYARFE